MTAQGPADDIVDGSGSRPRLAVIAPARTVRMGGVQRFGDELVKALTRLAHVEVYRVHPQPDGSRGVALWRGVKQLRRDHRERNFDAVITTFHWPPRMLGIPMLGTIHDLRPWRGKARWSHGLIARAVFARSWNAVLVPTEHVAHDVRRLIGDRRDVVVVGEGVDHLDSLRPDPATRDRIVVLGGSAPHKRSDLAAAAACRAAHTLGCPVTIVGGGAPVSLPFGVEVLDTPTDTELASAYASARVAVTATAYEGFGLSAGEAMRAGAPLVYCSDSTLAALAGCAGVACTPTVHGIESAIVDAWAQADELTARSLVAVRGLTWDQTARKVMAAVRSITNQP